MAAALNPWRGCAHVVHRAADATTAHSSGIDRAFDRRLEFRQHRSDGDIVPIAVLERAEAVIGSGATGLHVACKLGTPLAIRARTGFRPRFAAEVIAQVAPVQEGTDVDRIAAVSRARHGPFGLDASGKRGAARGLSMRSAGGDCAGRHRPRSHCKGELSPHGHRIHPWSC